MCLLALLAVQVLSIKASAKRRLQAQYGLATGEQYSVATFVGRMTQQKGCDVIAEVAAALMAKHPHLQIIVLGPSGVLWCNMCIILP
jgi:granule-bound starch synthase